MRVPLGDRTRLLCMVRVYQVWQNASKIYSRPVVVRALAPYYLTNRIRNHCGRPDLHLPAIVHQSSGVWMRSASDVSGLRIIDSTFDTWRLLRPPFSPIAVST